MLTVWYSNAIERLADALAIQLRRGTSPFATQTVVVPHLNLARWLKFELARRNGIASGLGFTRLEELLRDAVPAPFKLLEQPALTTLLHALLTNPGFIARDEARIVRAYVEANGTAEEAVSRRAHALASHLAAIFLQYRYGRPELLHEWHARLTFQAQDEPWRTLEQWQRHIWLALFHPGGLMERLEREGQPRWIFLDDVPRRVPPARLVLPQTLHLFDLQPVPTAFYETLRKIGELRDVHVYVINPSSQYWEEMQTGSRDEDHIFSSAAITGGSIGAAEESFWAPAQANPMLQAFGRAGRDHIWALNQRSGHMAQELFADPTHSRDALLQRLQQDILYAVGANERRDRARADDSITFLDCPSPRREAEATANAIWSLMRELDGRDGAPPLRFNEIAVLVPDDQRQAYAAHILAAFEATRRIPAEVIDERALPTPRMLDAVLQLLELPFGSFQRPQLLRLMLHPNVLAAFPGTDPNEWLAFTDALNIIHGADRVDLANTYLDDDLFNWDQGLKRLALGAFMDGDAPGRPRWFAAQTSTYIPEPLEPSQLTSAARFILLARSLIQDARFLRQHRAPLQQWAALLTGLLDAYIRPCDDDRPDLFFAWRSAIASLADHDPSGHPVAWPTAAASARRALLEVELHGGLFTGQGVVVSSIGQAAGIPFRVLFVLGLNEGHFPAPEVKDPLDLRQHRFQRCDVSDRDRDRYRFLQLILSARDALFLGWTSLDTTSGEDLEPASVVIELRQMIERFSVRPADLTIRHRPQRHDTAYFPALHGDSSLPRGAEVYHRGAFDEARMAALREDLLRAFRRRGVVAPDLKELPRIGSPKLWADLQPILQPWRVPAEAQLGGAGGRRRALSLSLNRLRHFLDDPLQAQAELRIQRFASPDPDAFTDILEVNHEPFDADFAHQRNLLRYVVHTTLLDPSPWTGVPELYNDTARRLAMRGELPAGLFRQATRRTHMRLLETWRNNLRFFDIDPAHHARLIALGRHMELASVHLPPIRLQLPPPDDDPTPLLIDLHGTTEPDLADQATILTVAWRSDPATSDFLRAFLTHATLCVLFPEHAIERRAVINTAKPQTPRTETSPHIARFAPIPPDRALAWLQDLASDLLSLDFPWLLPADVALDYIQRFPNAGPAALRELLTAWLNKVARERRRLGPIRRLANLPVPDDPDTIIRRRFGLFLESRVEG